MTSVVSPDRAHAPPPGVLRAVAGRRVNRPVAPTWGWAVVEIRSDGTWGRPQVVPADGPEDAAATAAAHRSSGRRRLRSCRPRSRPTSVRSTCRNGCLPQAVTALTRGTGARASSACAPRLPRHAWPTWRPSRATSVAPAATPAGPGNPRPTTLSPGAAHAQLARAWIALERADFARDTPAPRCRSPAPLDPDHEPWLATSRLLVEARLLVATGQPDAATRLLAGAAELASVSRTSGWLADLVTIARAEALVGVRRTAAGAGPGHAPAGARGRRGQRRGGSRSAGHRRRQGRRRRSWPRRCRAGQRAACLADPGLAARVAARRGPRQA